jgi:lambda repressor-like predicted transcriptional regulator
MSLAEYGGSTDKLISVRKRASAIREVALRNGISVDTLRREIKAGKGPKVTQISARRQVILDIHENEWLASRVIRPKVKAV